MWASIPFDQSKKFDNAVMPIHSQVPAGYTLFLVAPDVSDKKNVESAANKRAVEMFEEHFAGQKGVKFHPEYVELWHARHIPPQQVVVGNNPWDKHPSYSGPEDTRVFVYIPKLAEERLQERREAEWKEKEKAKIAAKAATDQKAVDSKPAPEGALAAGGPTDPTLPENVVAKKKKAPAAPKAAVAEVTAVPKKKAAAKPKKGA